MSYRKQATDLSSGEQLSDVKQPTMAQVTQPVEDRSGGQTVMSRRNFLAFAAGLTTLFALPLAACDNREKTKGLVLGEPLVFPPSLTDSGVLRVGVSSDRVPLAGLSGSNIIGLDVDLSAAMADQMGLRLQLVDVVDKNVTDLFINREIDMLMGYHPDNLTHSPYSLVGPYLTDAPAVFARGYSMPQGGFDINTLAGHRVAVREDSLSEYLLKKQFGTEAIYACQYLADAFAAAANGVCTYVASDAVVGAYLASRYRDMICLGFIEGNPQGVYIAVNAGHQEMTDTAAQYIRLLRDLGLLALITQKWLGRTAADLVLSPDSILGNGGNPGGVSVDRGDDLPDPSSSNPRPED